MSEPMKMSFVDKLKSVFKSKPAPTKPIHLLSYESQQCRPEYTYNNISRSAFQMIQAEDSVLWQI